MNVGSSVVILFTAPDQFSSKTTKNQFYIWACFIFPVAFWLILISLSILHVLWKTFTFSAIALLCYCGEEDFMVVQTYYVAEGIHS